MKVIEGFEAARLALSRRGMAAETSSIDEREPAIRQNVVDVRRRGDTALFDYTEKFDGVKLASLEVTKQQIADAYHRVDSGLLAALKLAAQRISELVVGPFSQGKPVPLFVYLVTFWWQADSVGKEHATQPARASVGTVGR